MLVLGRVRGTGGFSLVWEDEGRWRVDGPWGVRVDCDRCILRLLGSRS